MATRVSGRAARPKHPLQTSSGMCVREFEEHSRLPLNHFWRQGTVWHILGYISLPLDGSQEGRAWPKKKMHPGARLSLLENETDVRAEWVVIEEDYKNVKSSDGKVKVAFYKSFYIKPFINPYCIWLSCKKKRS